VQRHAATTGISINRIGTQTDQHLDQNLSAVDCLRSFFDSSQRRDPYFLVFNWTNLLCAGTIEATLCQRIPRPLGLNSHHAENNPTFPVRCRNLRAGNTTNLARLKRRPPFFGRSSGVNYAQKAAFQEW
jgi:hypothetical protein